jgi:hypothetical protein
VLTRLPLKAVNNAIDKKTVTTVAGERAGRPTRLLDARALVSLAIERRLTDRIAPELRRKLFDALASAPRNVVSLEGGLLKINLREPRRADTDVLAPTGTRIAFTGGIERNDHTRIWDALDKIRAKHPDMVLLHGGSPRGAERIAACWADSRKIAQVVFKPDWNRHRKAAPFKRNDAMLDALPVGVIVFPGSGISANLADKAKKLGIPVWRFSEDGAA